MPKILIGMRNGSSRLQRAIYLIGVGLTFATQALVAEEKNTPETQIGILLNCAVIIASTEDGMNSYEDYVIAASYLAADNGLSSEWLNEKIQLASETAYEFAGQTRAAERCVATLRSAKELLQ